MATINVHVTRSAEYIRAARVASGENVSERIIVPVELGALSPQCRVALLDYFGGSYQQHLFGLSYTSDFEVRRHGTYGSAEIRIDSDAPTVDEVEAAIWAAFAAVEEKKAKHELETAEREAKDQAEALAWAALPLHERDDVYLSNAHRRAPKADAELQEWRALKAKAAKAEAAIADRDTLAEFLYNVPADALRGTLKAMIADGAEEGMEELRAKVESASPHHAIFGDAE